MPAAAGATETAATTAIAPAARRMVRVLIPARDLRARLPARPAPHARAGSVVWVDIDGEPQGSELGRMAALRPHLTVHSGGGLHCYWRLEREQEPDEIESLNRRLCMLIGGDPSCTDRGRIMRLPGSFNGERGRWCASCGPTVPGR